jgi:hypothetical protein
MKRTLVLLSTIALVVMGGLHLASWTVLRSFPLWVSLAAAGIVLAACVPAGIDYRLRGGASPIAAVYPLSFCAVALTGLYALILWMIATDARGATAGAAAASMLSTLWWSARVGRERQ